MIFKNLVLGMLKFPSYSFIGLGLFSLSQFRWAFQFLHFYLIRGYATCLHYIQQAMVEERKKKERGDKVNELKIDKSQTQKLLLTTFAS